MDATSIILFIIKTFLHTNTREGLANSEDMEDLMYSTMDLVASDTTPIPGVPLVWTYVLEYTCQRIIAPYLAADAKNRLTATVHHTKPSPKEQD